MSSPVDPRTSTAGPVLDDIDLGDGTWEDLGDDGRWRPAPGDRVRAAVFLAVALVFVGAVAWIASLVGDPPRDTAAPPSSAEESSEDDDSEPEDADQASLAGEPPPPGCESDDRGALPLRERQSTLLLVLNGTPRAGHASAVTAGLGLLGYGAVEPGNAGSVERTTVAYKVGFCAEADRLAAELGQGDPLVLALDEEAAAGTGRARLVVTLGADSL